MFLKISYGFIRVRRKGGRGRSMGPEGGSNQQHLSDPAGGLRCLSPLPVCIHKAVSLSISHAPVLPDSAACLLFSPPPFTRCVVCDLMLLMVD